MSVLTFLYTLLIRPLELLFEVIFVLANRVIGNPGLTIIVLSLAVNFLVLPLYKRADEMQEEERNMQARLEPWIKHIKKTFHGDERFMILQTYYRQNRYKPFYALRGSLSLLLQIPFFIAAYNFLSGLAILRGMSFGPIRDLGAQDAMFHIGSFPVNVLPILMTLVNIISGAIYTKGKPLKLKIQLYAMALLFLVLLYTSPSGLVFYWMLNNVFSLVKNIFYRLKNPKRVLFILFALTGAAVGAFSFIRPGTTTKQRAILLAGGFVLMLPLILSLILQKREGKKKEKKEVKPSAVIFFGGALLLSVLMGLLIPSNVIKTSTAEFVHVQYYNNPADYLWYSCLLALGTFVVWGGVFYLLCDKKVKPVFDAVTWILCGVCFLDYMGFGTKLGVLSSDLQYEIDPVFSKTDYLLNLGAIALVCVLLYVIYRKLPKLIPAVLAAGVCAMVGIGCMNIHAINRDYRTMDYVKTQAGKVAQLPLSKTGKNVIVFMLDRSTGTQIPYILNERPELVDQFDGFTYYENTVSFGSFTHTGAAPLFGGYEYTPEEMNRRDSEMLVDKHNEALKVLPVLFDENNYDVTVCDPPYAGYQWVSDLSIYDDYPEIHRYNTDGHMNNFSGASFERTQTIRKRNFFCFSIVRTVPLFMQATLYNSGYYNEAAAELPPEVGNDVYVQVRNGLSYSYGYDLAFLNAFSVLENLESLTVVTENEKDSFLMLQNATTHAPCLLQKPNYTPSLVVDNTALDEGVYENYVVDGVKMNMDQDKQVTSYHANVAAFIQLGKWFDYLREQGVYDNTKIIIVSDHGRNLEQFDLIYNNQLDTEFFRPTLMVKDFNATGFTTSHEFMTNADVPALATEGVIENAENPFTGNPLDGREKKNGKLTLFHNTDWDVSGNKDNKFTAGSWYTVQENANDMNNWDYLGDY